MSSESPSEVFADINSGIDTKSALIDVDSDPEEKYEKPSKTYGALVGYGLCVNMIIGTGVFKCVLEILL